MQWALVCTTEMVIPNPEVHSPSDPPTITVPSGTIVSIIVYDGHSPYTPPENTVLLEVPDSARIGDEGY